MISNCKFDLDIKKMRIACKTFVGTHNFKDFQCVGSDTNTSIREIFNCELTWHESNMHGIIPDHWILEVTGNGFLKQMVRLIVGALWNIGRGKISISDLEESLKNPSGDRLGAVAPANGLYKISVEY